MITLETPVDNLQMVGSFYSGRLKKLGIETISDFLYHLPHRYEDYSLKTKINQLQTGIKASVIGNIEKFTSIYTKYGKKIQKALLSDDTGKIDIVWYNQPYLLNVIKIGTTVSIAGNVKKFGNKLVFESPDYEIIRATDKLVHTGRLVPIYPETEGLSSKWIRSRIDTILNILSIDLPEHLPQSVLQKYRLISLNTAIRSVHYPNSYRDAERARHRLSFDEILLFQLITNLKKKEWENINVNHRFEVDKFKMELDEFIKSLPFELTSDQINSVKEILLDLKSVRPMNRLLLGDVGSGKTVVAAIAIYLTFINGLKSILMAPTEILANQHYEVIAKFLEKKKAKVNLVTGKSKNLQSDSDVFIGTHALLFKNDIFEQIGLVVIDEQQRFGVAQRSQLREKSGYPHLLTMTATPIPRTIALTLYSDLSLSVLNNMPKGRIKPKTWVIPVEKREKAYEWIKNEIKNNGSQAFIVCPFIDPSDSLESVKSASVEYEKLKSGVFPDLKMGLLHGRLKPKEKNKTLNDFASGKLDILVTTPVVEVGIDIPGASIIMIEGADRFGLSQLHQLRGRVGRRNQQSYCLLFTSSTSQKTIDRLQLLTKIFSGPQLSEEDLKLRGAGEIYGTRQHGLSQFKIADLTDLVLIKETKEAAEEILHESPKLDRFLPLKEKVKQYRIGDIAPD